MKKNIKITIGIILLIILGVVLKYTYDYYNNQKVLAQEEQENIKIDEYNFEQLEKVKAILDSLDKDSYSFDNIKEFNEKFNQDIKPIKNCYILADKNHFYADKNKDNFIFMTRIYSNYYRKVYKSIYYIYPEYRLEIIEDSLCTPHGGECGTDQAFSYYLKIISTSCEEYRLFY